MKQVKVLRHDRGEAYLQETINDWIIEQHLIGKDVDVDRIHVLNNGTMIIFYDETDSKNIDEIVAKYKERKKEENYFKSK